MKKSFIKLTALSLLISGGLFAANPAYANEDTSNACLSTEDQQAAILAKLLEHKAEVSNINSTEAKKHLARYYNTLIEEFLINHPNIALNAALSKIPQAIEGTADGEGSGGFSRDNIGVDATFSIAYDENSLYLTIGTVISEIKQMSKVTYAFSLAGMLNQHQIGETIGQTIGETYHYGIGEVIDNAQEVFHNGTCYDYTSGSYIPGGTKYNGSASSYFSSGTRYTQIEPHSFGMNLSYDEKTGNYSASKGTFSGESVLEFPETETTVPQPIEEEENEVASPIDFSPNLETNELTFKWDAMENATRYRINVYLYDMNTGTYVKQAFPVNSTNDTTFTYQKAVEGGLYKVEVIPQINYMYTAEKMISDEVAFVKETNDVPSAINFSPNTETNELTFNWEPMEGASRYRINVYLYDNETESYVKQAFPVNSTALSTFTYKKAVQGGLYKVEVIPQIDYMYKADKMISEEVLFPEASPSEPVEDGSEAAPLIHFSPNFETNELTFNWEPMEDATRYRINVYLYDAVSESYVKQAFAVNSTALTTFTYKNAVKDGLYKVEVIPQIAYMYKADKMISEEVSFAEEIVNDIPLINFAPNLETNELTFNWEAMEEATRYRINVYLYDTVSESYVKQAFAVNSTALTTFTYKNAVKDGLYKVEVIPQIDYMYVADKMISEEVVFN